MRRILLIVWAAAALGTALEGQVRRRPESLSAWLFFKEIQIPPNASGLLDFVLDRDMLNGAKVDQSDLRLYDSAGHEIPFVPRIRREVDTSAPFTAHEFNRSAEGGVSQISYDLGEQPQQHNEVEIDSAGVDFRRLVEVQGSSDGAQWSTLVSGAIVFQFTARGRTVEQKAVDYPVSRYRYLRIRVERDSQTDRGAPEVTGAQIFRTVRIKGEMVSFPGVIESRDSDRVNGRPASIWRVDFGARIPFERLVIQTGGGVFSRPFQLEEADDPTAPNLLASGTLARSEDAESPQLTVDFQERFARHVRLSMTDDRNTPLAIEGFTAFGAAREVVFDSRPAGPGPLRVYYGNHRALAPRYDLRARLPVELIPPPQRLALGPQRDNPIYSPEPRPFSERVPWLVYLVLGAASVALAAILLSLVRMGRQRSAAA